MDAVKGPDVCPREMISEWITLYEREMLRLCCAYLKDLQFAEEVVQEVFVKAYRHIGTFRGSSSPRTWLTRIAINECKNTLRSRRYREAVNAVGYDQIRGSYEPDWALHAALRAEIMRLPNHQRDAVLLRYYQDMSLSETARALGVSPATASRWLDKALAALQRTLKGETDG